MKISVPIIILHFLLLFLLLAHPRNAFLFLQSPQYLLGRKVSLSDIRRESSEEDGADDDSDDEASLEGKAVIIATWCWNWSWNFFDWWMILVDVCLLLTHKIRIVNKLLQIIMAISTFLPWAFEQSPASLPWDLAIFWFELCWTI